MKSKFSIASALAATVVAGALTVASAPAVSKDIVLNMAGPDWGPTRFLQEYFNKTYKAKSQILQYEHCNRRGGICWCSTCCYNV